MITVRVACFYQHKVLDIQAIDVCGDGGAYSSGLSSSEQEVEALARKTVHGLLRLGQSFRLHQVGEDSAILGVVEGSLDVLRNHNIHLVHNRLDVFTHVVGQERENLGHLAAKSIVSHHVGAAEERLYPGREVRLPAFLSQEAHRFTEGILRHNISGKAIECFLDVKRLLSGESQHLVGGHLRKLFHFALKLKHLLAREEFGQRALAHPVDFMVDGRKSSHRDRSGATSVQLVLPFIANTSRASVDLVREVRVRAMQFIRVDSDNGP